MFYNSIVLYLSALARVNNRLVLGLGQSYRKTKSQNSYYEAETYPSFKPLQGCMEGVSGVSGNFL